MADKNLDELGIKTLDKTKKLNILLSKDFAINTLEIGKNADSTVFSKQLIRLENALENYLSKQKDLFYIGFMGTFSAGKSSTINSILNLNDTNESRQTGRNPTDKKISLITHSDNKNSLISNAKQGEIAIVPIYIDNDFLHDKVIIDTPGSSDPRIGYQDVIDALPLCDLIFYLFSATNPFNKDDVPILTLQQQKLNKIPLNFIVTRATDFKKNLKAPLSTENFDKEQYVETFSETIERIRETLENTNFDLEDFICIDNLEEFHINELKDLINSKIKNRDYNLHGHKINFFKDEIEHIRSYFETKMDNKIRKVSEFFDQVEKNKIDFQNIVTVGEGRLKQDWEKGFQNLKLKKEGTIRQLEAAIKKIKLDKEFYISSNFKNWKSGYLLEIKKLSESHAKKFISSKIRHFTELTEKALAFHRGNNASFDDFEISDTQTIDSILLPSEISIKERTIENLYNYFLSYISNTSQTALNETEILIKQISKNKFLNDTKEQIIDSTNYLNEEFDKYFRAVGKYVTLVNSTATKEYMAVLGLSQRFDKLDIKFLSDEEMKLYKDSAINSIFTDFKSYIDNFSDENSSIYKRAKKITVNLNELNSTYITSKKNYHYSPAQSTSIANLDAVNIENELKGKLKNIIVDSKKIANELFLQKDKELQEYKSEINKRRFLFYLRKIGIPTGIVLTLTILYFYYGHIEVPDSFQLSVIIGILINLLTPLISTVFARKSDNFKELIKKRKDLNLTNVFDSFQTSIKEKLNELSSNEEKYVDKLQSSLYDNWLNLTGSINSNINITPLNDIYKKLVSNSDEFIDEIQNYINNISTPFQHISKFFTSAENNLKTVRDITHEIKEKSIQPSLNLLESTQKNLMEIKNNLEELQ